MSDMCSDNRFEIIAKAKEKILEGTNIDASPDEMKVLDNFLFRCWQMGWLDMYGDKEIYFADAWKAMRRGFKETRTDELDGDIYSSWVSNLACYLMDNAGLKHDKANEVARGFIDHAFVLGDYESMEGQEED